MRSLACDVGSSVAAPLVLVDQLMVEQLLARVGFRFGCNHWSGDSAMLRNHHAGKQALVQRCQEQVTTETVPLGSTLYKPTSTNHPGPDEGVPHFYSSWSRRPQPTAGMAMAHACTCVKMLPNLQIASCRLPAHISWLQVFVDTHRWFWRTLRPLYGSRTVMTGQHSNTTWHGFPACGATCAAGALCRIDLSPLRCSTSQALWQAPPAWFETTLEIWVAWHLDSQWCSCVRETCLLSDRLEEYLFDEMELKYQVPQSAHHKSLDVTLSRISRVFCVSCCSMFQDFLLWILSNPVRRFA